MSDQAIVSVEFSDGTVAHMELPGRQAQAWGAIVPNYEKRFGRKRATVTVEYEIDQPTQTYRLGDAGAEAWADLLEKSLGRKFNIQT